ncbi:hypothetical protein O1M54_09660 [Streptomyces diastatochromogenes]|nr:hypothetical protein [Streptomyces diastatochromogenes]
MLYLPGRRRVWSLVDPQAVHGLRDLALERAPRDSGTLYGTEAGPSVIRPGCSPPGGSSSCAIRPDSRWARTRGRR